MNIGRRYQLLLLVFICLGIYYPVFFNTTMAIDDVDMVRRMANGSFSWAGLFSPRSSFYYRPLLILSFWFDLWVWDFQQTFSLFENVLLHAANSILVFLIAERYLRPRTSLPYLPLCSAMIFAVHPLATESINWMSGRTDLLGTFFVLLSVVLLHRALRCGSYGTLLLSLVSFVAAVLSKEVMVFFLPAAIYLIILQAKTKDAFRFPSQWKPIILYILPVFAGAVSYVVFRMLKHGASSHSLFQRLSRMPYDGVDLLRVTCKVFGFYAKKLFFPLPLNFAIIDVSDMYVFLGVGCFLLLVWMLRRHSLRWAFLCIACFMIAPGVLIALAHVAWTPLAERYVYLPSAFFSLGVVAALPPFLTTRRIVTAFVSLMLLWLILSALASAKRSALWQDKEAFYADTIKKSPGFARLRNEYGVALLEGKQSDEALAQFRQGQTSKGGYFPLINEARILLVDGKPDEAREVLLRKYPDKSKLGVRGLKMLTHIEAERLKQTEDPQLKESIIKDLFAAHELIYRKTRDPFHLYRSGQIALKFGAKTKAQELFSRAHRFAPGHAHYKTAAGKLAKSLQDELRVGGQ